LLLQFPRWDWPAALVASLHSQMSSVCSFAYVLLHFTNRWNRSWPHFCWEASLLRPVASLNLLLQFPSWD